MPMTAERGFTLIELVVSIAAAGVLFTLLATAFAPGVVQSADPLYALRAAELGQSYLEDVLGKAYDEASLPGNAVRCGEGPACAGLGTEEGRANWDDADDYQALCAAPEAPLDATNTVRPGYEQFRVAVCVAYAGAELGLANNAVAKRVTVTITDPRGGSHVYAAYKTNF